MKQALWIGLLLMMVMGCKQTPQEMVTGPKTPNSPGNQSGKPTDSTQNPQCKGKTPANASIYGTWSADFTQGKGQLHQVFRIEKNSVAMSLTCTERNVSVTVEASVPADILDSEIHLLKTDSNYADFYPGGATRRCIAELRNTENIKYSFVGPCLHLESDLRDALLVLEK